MTSSLQVHDLVVEPRHGHGHGHSHSHSHSHSHGISEQVRVLQLKHISIHTVTLLLESFRRDACTYHTCTLLLQHIYIEALACMYALHMHVRFHLSMKICTWARISNLATKMTMTRHTLGYLCGARAISLHRAASGVMPIPPPHKTSCDACMHAHGLSVCVSSRYVCVIAYVLLE